MGERQANRDAVRVGEELVFEPGHRAELSLAMAERIRRGKGQRVRFELGQEFEEYFLPLFPGNLVSVLGLSGNLKSGWLQHLGYRVSRGLVRDKKSDRCVVYVSWEQTVEEMGVIDFARTTGIDLARFSIGNISDDEWRQVEVAAVKMVGTPMYIIGHSLEKPSSVGRLTLHEVEGALAYMAQEMRVVPTMVILDYLQAMDYTGQSYNERRLEVRENIYRSKDLAMKVGCPVILAVQAKQEVWKRAVKLPGMYDGEETSAIAQRSDRVLGLWYPVATEGLGREITIQGVTREVTEEMLFVGVSKQKLGPAGRVFEFEVNPAQNEFKLVS